MQTVISAFDDRKTAERAVERLVDAGFERDDIHLQQGLDTSASSMSTTADLERRENGEDRGFFASIGHFFASLFGEDNPSGRSGTYAEAVRRGTSVVVVDAHDDEEADRAATLLHELGAVDVDERAEQWRASGWTGYTADEPMRDTSTMGMAQPATGISSTTAMGATEDAGQTRREGVMDVVQEELQVGKRSIDRGGVRVVQRVSEQPVRELVRLREERAVVDRRPVDRPATAEDLSNFGEGTVEVREMTEEPVVAKTARVVEEVRVGKDVREREETIEDTVRRKDVDVERLQGEADTRSMEREDRAFAADTSADSESATRDPDATDKKTLTRKSPSKTTRKKT